MRSVRLATSTPELDAQETRWWDSFATTCERLWTFDETTALAARGAYLQQGADYLVGDRPDPVILDLGCGSGFTSRFLAERGARVVGIDVSPEQIELARAKARTETRSVIDRLEFKVASNTDLEAAGEQYDGVIGHAFLHHLARDELDVLLAQVAQLLRPKARAWFLEPVFFPPGQPSTATRTTQIGALASAALQRAFRSSGQLDPAPLAAADAFFAEAERNGWFLSPKEVPFSPTEVQTVFSSPLELERFAWVSTASYPTAQWVSLIRRTKLRHLLGKTVIRSHSQLDLALGASGGIDRLRGADGYGFAALSCRAA